MTIDPTTCGPAGCDPVPTAEGIYDGLVNDADFTIPDVSNIQFPVLPTMNNSAFTQPSSVELKDLTVSEVNGSGAFDVLMKSVTAHLDRERSQGRITNNEFAKSYVEFSTAAMGAAIQFLLSKDQAYWASVTAQNQAKLSLVELAKAQVEFEETKLRMQMVGYQAAQVKAEVALTKMRLATAQVEYCTAQYNLEHTLPQELLNLKEQEKMLTAQHQGQTLQNTTLLPEQVRNMKAQADMTVSQMNTLLPKQVIQLDEQIKLTKEQTESQRAQTLDTRTDGAIVTGTLGKQKELHSQQIDAYRKDSQLKAARPFIDAWITMKTIDEGVAPPNGFANVSLDQILTKLKNENSLT